MSTIIDKTAQGSSKSATNRAKFMKRYKDVIRESVKKAVGGRSIKDLNKGHDVDIKGKSITEPYIGTGNEGAYDYVRPGNEEYSKGDRLRRKQGGGNGKSGSNSPDVFEDDFVFSLSKDEFMDIFFEDLCLPNFIKKSLHNLDDVKYSRAGHKKEGPAATLDVERTIINSIARRISMLSPFKNRIKEIEAEIEENKKLGLDCADLEEKLRKLKSAAPFLDPLDLRYTNHEEIDNPGKTAVMFCILDVSGSMGQEEKDIAKRFFILLYMFLTRSYKNIEVVFIKHHTEAFEVDEEDFFNSRESGGTIVSSALLLTHQIIKERFPEEEYNIYVSQCSDGDNFYDDTKLCGEVLENSLLPLLQYFAYIEITDGDTQNLWERYKSVERKFSNFAMEMVRDASDIYPVFRYFFGA